MLSVQTKDRVINAIEIKSTEGTQSAWDTLPSSSNSPVGVALTSEPTRLLNHRDGSVNIPVKDSVELNLYVFDNGSIAEGKTKYKVTVSFDNGELSWCDAPTGNRSDWYRPATEARYGPNRTSVFSPHGWDGQRRTQWE